ncbi:uncharacterized protein LOC143986668 [Lithobates pipiens]
MQHLIIFHSSLQLLWKDQEERNHLVSDIRNNPFFKTIDWAELERKKAMPPKSEPICEEPSNNSMPLNEYINYLAWEAPISRYEQEYFTGFSYMSDSLKMSPMDLFSHPPLSPEKKPNFADCSDDSECQKEEPMDRSPILPLNIHGPVSNPMENHYKAALQQLAEQMVFLQPSPAVRQENLFTPWPMDYEEAHMNLKEPGEQNDIDDFGYQIQQPPQEFFPAAYCQENVFTPLPMYHEEAHNNVIEPGEQNYIDDFGYQIQQPPQDFFPAAYCQENVFTPWPMHHEEAHNNVIEPGEQNYIDDFGYQIQQPPQDFFPAAYCQENVFTPWPMYHEEAHNNVLEPGEQNYIDGFGYQIQQPPQDFFPAAYCQENVFTPWPMYHEEAHNNPGGGALSSFSSIF